MVKAKTVGAVHTHTHTHTGNFIENKEGIKAFNLNTRKKWAINGCSFNIQKINKLSYVKLKHRKIACSFCA